MAQSLTYDTLERLSVGRPVDRLGFIAELCRGKRVLDVGCLDETAIDKHHTESWLHGRISAVAERVIGIDSSANIPSNGLQTGPRSIIVRGDGIDPAVPQLHDMEVDKIVAGEFIEHIDEPLLFFRNIKRRFPGRELVVSTPNGTSLANMLLGLIGREAQHPDHVHVFTYKVLNTLCLRAGFEDWEIVPYHFYATEMKLRSRGFTRFAAGAAERAIRIIERFCPLLCFGYVVRVQL
ncbi:MAG TPA: methyltransferase domain-containing protein [Sphingomonas sp.]|uniref:methyltransferase domain-containing protein n=1 Tax=Sphingomonas sp. TaxID=28214 RepID=UPI002CABA1D8|nr:methyltransferase domain-containing protein [Sphingomonas sp.]HMI18417.1 methyltransferase domain-containing protein [Sphingomonas sp.]